MYHLWHHELLRVIRSNKCVQTQAGSFTWPLFDAENISFLTYFHYSSFILFSINALAGGAMWLDLTFEWLSVSFCPLLNEKSKTFLRNRQGLDPIYQPYHVEETLAFDR